MEDISSIILPKKRRAKETLLQWLYRQFITEKLYNALGIVLFILSGLFFAYGVSHYGVVFGAMMIIGIMAVPMLYAIINYPVFGIVLTIILANLLFGIMRLGSIDFPLGTVMDGMEVLLIIGFFWKMK